jgi:hypothetical protein
MPGRPAPDTNFQQAAEKDPPCRLLKNVQIQGARNPLNFIFLLFLIQIPQQLLPHVEDIPST